MISPFLPGQPSGTNQNLAMNRAPAPKILIASSHADTRVSVSWLLRQSYPDAIISKAETIAEALSTAETQSPLCVVSDTLLDGFATQVSEFSKSLWQNRIPLIVIHDAADAPQTSNDEPEIVAWMCRSAISVNTVALAISKAIELSTMVSSIDMLQQELQLTKKQLETASNTIDSLRAAEPVSDLSTTSSQQQFPSETPGLNAVGLNAPGLNAVGAAPSVLERPQLIKDGLSVSTEDEKELAGRVQKHLMPPGSPLIDGFDIAGLSIPAETTGGDYYDYLPMSDDLLCISIGECSGRGLAPAMLMASLRAYLRVLASSSTDISEILSQANTLITEDIGDEEFIVTLMLFQLDQRARLLRYASAGHQAFFFDGDGNVDVLHSTGMPLGLRDETVIVEGPSRKLQPGEILLLASDGVQKMTSDLGEQYGTDRMLNLVNENRTLPSRIIANYLRKSCTEFASPQLRSDDVTIVIVKGDDSVI